MGNKATTYIDPSGLEDVWWWWYNNQGGRDLDVSNYPDFADRIFNAARVSVERLLDRALDFAMEDAKRAGPGSAGQGILKQMDETHRFAGGKASKIVGGIIELLGGSITDSNAPTTNRTSLYALGDSTIVGTGTYSWKNGPLTSRSEIVRKRNGFGTECVSERVSTGFWVTATVNVGFGIRDEFKEPYRVTNGGIGKGIETGTPYKIGGKIGSRSKSRTEWVELFSYDRTLFERIDCRR